MKDSSLHLSTVVSWKWCVKSGTWRGRCGRLAVEPWVQAACRSCYLRWLEGLVCVTGSAWEDGHEGTGNTAPGDLVPCFLFFYHFSFFVFFPALGRFQLYNTVLSSVVTMLLYSRSSNLVHLIAQRFFKLWQNIHNVKSALTIKKKNWGELHWTACRLLFPQASEGESPES